jgi:hypothetical protein
MPGGDAPGTIGYYAPGLWCWREGRSHPIYNYRCPVPSETARGLFALGATLGVPATYQPGETTNEACNSGRIVFGLVGLVAALAASPEAIAQRAIAEAETA